MVALSGILDTQNRGLITGAQIYRLFMMLGEKLDIDELADIMGRYVCDNQPQVSHTSTGKFTDKTCLMHQELREVGGRREPDGGIAGG